MPYGLYLSAEGAHVQDLRMRVIANNMANVETVGFKRELATMQARYAQAIEDGMVSPGLGKPEDIGGGVLVRQTKTDFSPGPLKKTDLPTDFAIEGEGFFVVRKGDQNYLTRAGDFRVTAAGQLQTQQGYDVLDESGAPITISPDGGPWRVSPSGAITLAGGDVRTLAMVLPSSMEELTKVGENLFQATGGAKPLPAEQRRVADGYLEMSGVRPAQEMIALIETSRIMEANINMMKTQDQMLSGLVNRVLKV